MKRVTIKVAADTAPQAVANSLYKGVLAQVEEDDSINIVVRAVGAGAVNQAIKGIAIARGQLASLTHDIAVVPGFANMPDQNEPTKNLSVIVMRLILL